MEREKINIYWLRRDLRLYDNTAFYYALKGNLPVLPVFIFDRKILEKLSENDARVTFIYEQLQRLNAVLRDKHQSGIAIYYGNPQEIWQQLIQEYDINQVYTNRDYEPYALARDEQVKQLLHSYDIEFKTYKDQVIYEKNEVTKADGAPYVVYTHYKNKWLDQFYINTGNGTHVEFFNSEDLLDNCFKSNDLPQLALEQIGFKKASISIPAYNVSQDMIENYKARRDFPAVENGTSRLGLYLRFGVVSIRELVVKAYHQDEKTFLSELIWREFFMQILYHFPHTIDKAFKPAYDTIKWRNDVDEFEKWKNGMTGYPLVDAGMRELTTTGHMHNRVRMLVASFLCKHLLIDWRWGERFFAQHLLDYELASNVGNWQWAAGSGVDAAPYFRIFNPITQLDKFDKQRAYVNKWIPELGSDSYPDMMVDHKMARERCLSAYKTALS